MSRTSCMRELLVHIDRRALTRLRALVAPWRGKIRVLGSATYGDLAEEPGFSWAPFSARGLGVHFERRQVLLEAPMGQHKVAEVLHEMAHVFASTADPDRSKEYEFLGWEMAVAREVNLPLPAWREGNRDYILWDGGTSEPWPDPWPSEVGRCTDRHLGLLFAERVARAKELGLVDGAGRPRCIRMQPVACAKGAAA